jgi:hypothetical protein
VVRQTRYCDYSIRQMLGGPLLLCLSDQDAGIVAVHGALNQVGPQGIAVGRSVGS